MITFDALYAHTFQELNDLYARGETPEPDEVDGDYRGGVPGVSSDNLLGTLSQPVGFLSKQGILPWSGKSFSSESGKGKNRLLFDQLSLAPFEFRPDESLYDDDSCLVLDYGIKENLFMLNFIRDEVRQVGDGLLLGQMYFKPTSSLVLYFALEPQ